MTGAETTPILPSPAESGTNLFVVQIWYFSISTGIAPRLPGTSLSRGRPSWARPHPPAQKNMSANRCRPHVRRKQNEGEGPEPLPATTLSGTTWTNAP
jgi:hypothetical protein